MILIDFESKKLFIFDFDGTLFDTMGAWTGFGEAFVEYVGREPEKGLTDRLNSMPTLYAAAEFLHDNYCPEMTSDEIFKWIEDNVRDYYISKALPRKGVPEFLEKYAKPNGKLIFGRLFSKTDCPPKPLTDFDGEIETLAAIHEKIRTCGYYMTAMASDTDAQWENYVFWSAARDIERLRKNPEDTKTKAWLEKWYDIYFRYRRPFEGWALFGIEKL